MSFPAEGSMSLFPPSKLLPFLTGIWLPFLSDPPPSIERRREMFLLYWYDHNKMVVCLLCLWIFKAESFSFGALHGFWRDAPYKSLVDSQLPFPWPERMCSIPSTLFTPKHWEFNGAPPAFPHLCGLWVRLCNDPKQALSHIWFMGNTRALIA